MRFVCAKNELIYRRKAVDQPHECNLYLTRCVILIAWFCSFIFKNHTHRYITIMKTVSITCSHSKIPIESYFTVSNLTLLDISDNSPIHSQLVRSIITFHLLSGNLLFINYRLLDHCSELSVVFGYLFICCFVIARCKEWSLSYLNNDSEMWESQLRC